MKPVCLAIALAMLASGASYANGMDCEVQVKEAYGFTPPTRNSSPKYKNDYETALKEFMRIGSELFCEADQLSRYYVTEGRNQEAIWILNKVLPPDDRSYLRYNSTYNLIAFAHLQEGDLEIAAKLFRRQTEIPEFSHLPADDRMKIHNNLGYTLIQLARYQEALTSLRAAEKLGSQKAKFNIQKVESLIESLKDQAVDAPGVFAVVLASFSRKENVPGGIKVSARRAGVGEADVQVFKAEGSRYLITIGAFSSYPGAEAHLKAAKSAGVSDAWISTTTEWQNMTAEFANF